jgi:hypothetical protein
MRAKVGQILCLPVCLSVCLPVLPVLSEPDVGGLSVSCLSCLSLT